LLLLLSGTSFTLHRIREASNTTTATNYGTEAEIKDHPSVPVVNSSQNGPFLQLIKGRDIDVPKYILTKTHCGGFCSDCRPHNYIETPRSFQILCQSGNRITVSNSSELVTEQVTYHQSIVKKAIHVIRDPLDNVVSRFHLMYHRAQTQKNTHFATHYPNDSTGFQKWCADQDSRSILKKKDYRWIDDALAEIFLSVPCHQEFFRYVQWHNLAFTVSRDMGIPALTVHYRDYRDNLEIATNTILAFLELPRVAEGESFSAGKEYRDYYSLEQRLSVWRLVEELASAETLHSLKNYDVF